MIIIVNNGKIKVINEEDKLKISRLLNKSVLTLKCLIMLYNTSVIIYIIC